MDYVTTSSIFKAIERTSPADKKEHFYQIAIRYAHERAEYYLANKEAKKEIKDVLTQTEKALVEAWHELGVGVHALGKDTGWRDTGGDDREKIRNFACYLHFIMSVFSVQ